MSFLHIAVIALVQGITEFLPISSSGHLVLVPVVAGWPDQGLLIDVAVHVGTLGAVILYFYQEVGDMAVGVLNLLRGRVDKGARLAGLVIVATIPAIICGFALNYVYPAGIRSIVVIGWTTLIFGIVLYLADRFSASDGDLERLGVSHAVMIGLAQVLSLVPGTSRSGITMTAARALGYNRSEAARFSLLLSIPTIAGAGLLKGLELYERGNAALTGAAVLAVILAFVSALVAITLMMAWLRSSTFTPFAAYRVVLGIAILALGYGLIA